MAAPEARAPVWKVSVYLDNSLKFTEPLFRDMTLKDFKSHITPKVQALGVHDFDLLDLSNMLIQDDQNMMNSVGAVKIHRVRQNTVQVSESL